MKYHVIAGNFAEFNSFIRKKSTEMWKEGNTSISMSNFVYVSSVDTLRGLSEIQGFYVGTWKDREDIDEIQMKVKIIKEKMKIDEELKKMIDAHSSITFDEFDAKNGVIGPVGTITGISAIGSSPISNQWFSTTNGDPYITESRVREIIQEELSKLQTQP